MFRFAEIVSVAALEMAPADFPWQSPGKPLETHGAGSANIDESGGCGQVHWSVL